MLPIILYRLIVLPIIIKLSPLTKFIKWYFKCLCNFKKTSFDSALHGGVEEDEIEAEKKLAATTPAEQAPPMRIIPNPDKNEG